MSSCPPTRRIRRRSSTRAWPTGSAVDFAGNKLVVIVPTDNPARDQDAGRPRRRRASRSSPPATRSRSPSTPRSSSTTSPRSRATRPTSRLRTTRNIVSREDNVKAVVAKLELGEGDAAIVYVTDAKISTKVASVEVPGRRERPRDVRRRRRQGVAEPGRGFGVPHLAGRPGGAGRPERIRVPAAVVTDIAAERVGPATSGSGRPANTAVHRTGWGDRGLVAVAILFALFLGPARRSRWSGARCSMARSRSPPGRRRSSMRSG